MAGVEIGVAGTAAELDELYAFRYRIYVDEMRRPQKYADHSRRKIEDPLDQTAHNIVARHYGEIIGCVRVNFSRDGGLSYYENLLAMGEVGAQHPARTSLCTRLMVCTGHRNATTTMRLCGASFDLGLAHGMRWNFVDCNDHLVDFFSRLGYDLTHRPTHEEYGQVNAMRLDILDLENLIRVRSPFERNLRRFVTAGGWIPPISPGEGFDALGAKETEGSAKNGYEYSPEHAASNNSGGARSG